MKRRAFTLIEVLVVVGIIALLSTLLIVAIGKMQTSAKRQQTTQILENCRALWAEYDAVARPHFDRFPLPSPGNVTSGNADRTGSNVALTQAIISLMRSQPNVRAATDKYSAGKMTMPSGITSSLPSAATYTGQIFYTLNLLNHQPNYVQASYTDPNTQATYVEQYLCIHESLDSITGAISTPTSPPDTGYWLPVGGIANGSVVADTMTPIFLDAWGNPIICVFGGALGSGQTLNPDGSIPAGNGILRAGSQSIVVQSSDKRLFWASAGPDGDFSKGDDNLYSFEKP